MEKQVSGVEGRELEAHEPNPLPLGGNPNREVSEKASTPIAGTTRKGHDPKRSKSSGALPEASSSNDDGSAALSRRHRSDSSKSSLARKDSVSSSGGSASSTSSKSRKTAGGNRHSSSRRKAKTGSSGGTRGAKAAHAVNSALQQQGAQLAGELDAQRELLAELREAVQRHPLSEYRLHGDPDDFGSEELDWLPEPAVPKGPAPPTARELWLARSRIAFEFEGHVRRKVAWAEIIGECFALGCRGLSLMGACTALPFLLNPVNWGRVWWLASTVVKSSLMVFTGGAVGLFAWDPISSLGGGQLVGRAFSTFGDTPTSLLRWSVVRAVVTAGLVAPQAFSLWKFWRQFRHKYETLEFGPDLEPTITKLQWSSRVVGQASYLDDQRPNCLSLRDTKHSGIVQRVRWSLRSEKITQTREEDIELESAMELLAPKFDPIGVPYAEVLKRLALGPMAMSHIATERHWIHTPLVRNTVQFAQDLIAFRHVKSGSVESEVGDHLVRASNAALFD